MVQTRIEERLEAHDQEMLGMKKELSKLLVMEEKLMMIHDENGKSECTNRKNASDDVDV